MKLIYKGNYHSDDQLPKGTLPQNAVRFVEPETALELNKAAAKFVLPTLLMMGIVIAASYACFGKLHVSVRSPFFPLGMVLSFLCMPLHELLHAVCFGKDAEVEFYVSFKNLMMFVVSTQPVSKTRFIVLSLLPTVALGWLPLILWAVLPYQEAYSNLLFTCSIFTIPMGVGDYLNVYNAARQMPKGSMQQMSGFHSYWFVGGSSGHTTA